MDEQPENMHFSNHEVEILAEYEHKKFSLEKKEAGWKYGIEFDEEKKADPMLVSWDSLDEIYRKHIIESIKAWPEILAKANFKIEKLNFMCYCDAPEEKHGDGLRTLKKSI